MAAASAAAASAAGVPPSSVSSTLLDFDVALNHILVATTTPASDSLPSAFADALAAALGVAPASRVIASACAAPPPPLTSSTVFGSAAVLTTCFNVDVSGFGADASAAQAALDALSIASASSASVAVAPQLAAAGFNVSTPLLAASGGRAALSARCAIAVAAATLPASPASPPHSPSPPPFFAASSPPSFDAASAAAWLAAAFVAALVAALCAASLRRRVFRLRGEAATAKAVAASPSSRMQHAAPPAARDGRDRWRAKPGGLRRACSVLLALLRFADAALDAALLRCFVPDARDLRNTPSCCGVPSSGSSRLRAASDGDAKPGSKAIGAISSWFSYGGAPGDDSDDDGGDEGGPPRARIFPWELESLSRPPSCMPSPSRSLRSLRFLGVGGVVSRDSSAKLAAAAAAVAGGSGSGGCGGSSDRAPRGTVSARLLHESGGCAGGGNGGVHWYSPSRLQSSGSPQHAVDEQKGAPGSLTAATARFGVVSGGRTFSGPAGATGSGLLSGWASSSKDVHATPPHIGGGAHNPRAPLGGRGPALATLVSGRHAFAADERTACDEPPLPPDRPLEGTTQEQLEQGDALRRWAAGQQQRT